MGSLLRVVVLLYLTAIVVGVAVSLRQGSMGGHPVALFLNLAMGVAVTSMPLLVLAYAKRDAWFGRRQFSLRGLLITTTLVAMMLGLAVWVGR
jgi:hypothetical protein